jgi:3-phenylpropionate/cinnamic acid dioxygenase small subunit
MRGTLGNLRASNDDLRKRVADLEAERGRDKLEKSDLQGQITRLQDHEQYLQSVVRDRANYETISTQVEDVHRIVVRIDKKIGAS